MPAPKYSNGLSKCCGVHVYRANRGDWRCSKCVKSCERVVAQRQDALNDQLRDVARWAELEGCYDAADFIRRTVLKET